MNLRLRRVLLLLAIAVLLAVGASRWRSQPAPAAERTVILVGLDGFRADYLEKFNPPVLKRLAAEGVTAERMIPSFPSLTFPNFYTLATGLRPEKHGIINNSMFDPVFDAKFSLGSPAVGEGRWWAGEPVWLTAQQRGRKTACMFWPGSEAEIGGRRPDEWRKYDGRFTARQRVDTVLEWLARPRGARPGLITLYFHEADTAGHRHGPDSPEVAAAVKEVDDALGKLVQGIERQGLKNAVHLVCVSDHGMTELDPARTIALDTLVDLSKVQVDFFGAITGLRPMADGEAPQAMAERLKKTARHFQVYLKEEMPERFHFRDHRRIPPVLLLADEGWVVVKAPMLTEGMRKSFLKATHGFDPLLPSMAATFVANGPAFRKGVVLSAFENVEVYQLVCATLGLDPAPNQGSGFLAGQVLEPAAKGD